MRVWIFWVWEWMGGWGGVGWDVNVHCDCNHAVRSLALPHIRHATLPHVILHFHTYVMLRCCTFSCTSTRTSCYAAARSLALPHIRHATLLHILVHVHAYVMLRCYTFSCTSTHTSCYAAARSLALPHIRHAASQNSLLCWWLQSLERSLQTTSARKTPQMAKLCPQQWWVCEALGRKPTKKSSSLAGTQTLDRQWDWLKTRFPGSWIHMKTADKTSEKIGSTCMLQSGARASKAMSWTTWDNFVLERKKEHSFIARLSLPTLPPDTARFFWLGAAARSELSVASLTCFIGQTLCQTLFVWSLPAHASVTFGVGIVKGMGKQKSHQLALHLGQFFNLSFPPSNPKRGIRYMFVTACCSSQTFVHRKAFFHFPPSLQI